MVHESDYLYLAFFFTKYQGYIQEWTAPTAALAGCEAQSAQHSSLYEYLESRCHVNASSEWNSIYGSWRLIDLLYNFCGSEKIKFYLKNEVDLEFSQQNLRCK
jgi:hypothetical protein